MGIKPHRPSRNGLAGQSRRYGLERDTKMLRVGNREIELFEPDDPASRVLHQNDLFAGFLTNVFLGAVRKPHRECVALTVVEQLHFGHIRTPSLIASVGYAVIRNPSVSVSFRPWLR